MHYRGKNPKQGLISAKDLSIELPEGYETPCVCMHVYIYIYTHTHTSKRDSKQQIQSILIKKLAIYIQQTNIRDHL